MLLPVSAILVSYQYPQGNKIITNQVVVNISRWLKVSNTDLTYHVNQIRHDAFDLNNVYVLNLQTQEKNYLI